MERSGWVGGLLGLVGMASFVPGMAAQDFPNRWEGLKSEFNSRPKFQIRAVFGADDVANAGRDSLLKVSYFVPPGTTVSDLQAWELHDVLNYQMRPKLTQLQNRQGAWATFGNWPVRDVLAPNGISPSALGVLIRLRDAQTPELFAPALLYTGTAPRRVSSYAVVLSSDTAVTRVRCIVRDHNGSAKGPSGTPYGCELPNGVHSLAEKLPGRFTVNASELPAGMVSVTILGEYPNDESGNGLHAEVHFFHEPEVKVP